METTFKSDATEMCAADLLRSAARLIERALIKLDVRHDMCRDCGTVRYKNLEQKRIYDKFTDTPTKLIDAAKDLDDPAGAAERKKLGHTIERGIKRDIRARHAAGTAAKE